MKAAQRQRSDYKGSRGLEQRRHGKARFPGRARLSRSGAQQRLVRSPRLGTGSSRVRRDPLLLLWLSGNVALSARQACRRYRLAGRGRRPGIDLQQRDLGVKQAQPGGRAGSGTDGRCRDRQTGYSGYVRDLDGQLWEVAWNPRFPLDEAGHTSFRTKTSGPAKLSYLTRITWNRRRPGPPAEPLRSRPALAHPADRRQDV